MRQLTRREFLKTSALGIATLAMGGCRKRRSANEIHDRSKEHSMYLGQDYPNLFCHPNDPDIVLMNNISGTLELAVNGVPKKFYDNYPEFKSRYPVIREEGDKLMVYFLGVSPITETGRIMRFPYDEPVKAEPISDPFNYHELDLSHNGDLLKWSGYHCYLEDRLLHSGGLRFEDGDVLRHLDSLGQIKILPYISLEDLEIYSLDTGTIYRYKAKKIYDDMIELTAGRYLMDDLTSEFQDFELIGSKNVEKLVLLQGTMFEGCDLWICDLNTKKLNRISHDVEKGGVERWKRGLAVSKDGKYAYSYQEHLNRVVRYEIDGK